MTDKELIASLLTHIEALKADIEALKAEARSVVDLTEPYTCERDYRAGDTILLRIPKRFLPVDVTTNPLQHQLLDLITLMPDSQTQEIVDYILQLRASRAQHDA